MKTKSIINIGLFTAIISIMSVISIPAAQIPFTLSFVGVFLTGALLPPRDAFISCICYLLLGIAGLPVFAGFRSGLQVIVGYTGGFLLSYPLMALTTSLFVKHGKSRLASILGMALSLIISYFCGTMVFMLVSGNNFMAAVSICVLPYVFFDTIKIVISSLLAAAIKRALKNI